MAYSEEIVNDLLLNIPESKIDQIIGAPISAEEINKKEKWQFFITKSQHLFGDVEDEEFAEKLEKMIMSDEAEGLFKDVDFDPTWNHKQRVIDVDE